MKIKQEYLILFVMILALCLYLILRSSDKSHYKLPEISSLVEKDISKIEISKTDSSIILKKKDDVWSIDPQGYPADAGKVKDMLAVIENLTLTALVSESKDYNRYELNDDKKIAVKAWIGGKLGREFEVGKTASSYRHTFVKLANDHRVYHARESFRDKFDRTVGELRDKAVLTFDQNEIKEMKITKQGQTVAFLRKLATEGESAGQDTGDEDPTPDKEQTVWQTDKGKEGRESELRSLLATLSKLRCEKYMDGRKKDEFANPIYTIWLKGTGEYTLSFFAKTEKDATDHPATSSENDYPFFLQNYQANKIMKDPDEMLKKPDK